MYYNYSNAVLFLLYVFEVKGDIIVSYHHNYYTKPCCVKTKSCMISFDYTSDTKTITDQSVLILLSIITGTCLCMYCTPRATSQAILKASSAVI